MPLDIKLVKGKWKRTDEEFYIALIVNLSAVLDVIIKDAWHNNELDAKSLLIAGQGYKDIRSACWSLFDFVAKSNTSHEQFMLLIKDLRDVLKEVVEDDDEMDVFEA